MAANDRPIKGQRPDTRTPGYTYLPGGPAFQDPSNLVQYLRENPGYAWKHRDWLTAQSKREFGLAGYSLAKNGQMMQYEGSADSGPARGKLVAAWLHDPKVAAQLAKGAAGTKVMTVKEANAQTAGAAPSKPAAKPTAQPIRTLTDSAGASGGTPAVDFSGLFGGVSAPSSRDIPEAWAQGGAKLFGPDVADNLAAMQFDGEIGQTERNAARAPKITDQNIADIGNWFGQVLKSEKTASGRDAAINTAAVDSVRDAGASILSSIGGAASGGAGLVGAANEQAVGTLEALGANQEAYNSDLAPLLQAEAAGAKTREQAQGSSRAADLADRLAMLQGDRGRAKAGFQFEVDKSNNAIQDNRNTRAMEIRQANNGLAQQEFQNTLALVNAQMGAALTGVEIQNKLHGGDPKPTHYPFAKAPVSQRTDAFNSGLAALAGPDGKPVPYPRAVQTVRNLLNGYGWSFKNPAVKTLAMNIMRQAGFNPEPRNFGPR